MQSLSSAIRSRPAVASRRHDRPVDALFIWLASAAVLTGLDRLTGLSSVSGDLHGLVLGALTVYASALLIERIAIRAAHRAPAVTHTAPAARRAFGEV